MDNKLKIWKILFLLFLAVATVFIIRNNRTRQEKESGKSTATSYITDKGKVFGTFYSITYCADSSMHNEIKDRLAQVDNSLSPFNKKSIISAINENRDTLPNDMFLKVFTRAQEIAQETDGAFDITVAPLVNAWGFGFKKGYKVKESTIDSLRQFIGHSTLSIENGRITKQNPQTMLDCSAIAKGYGCDAVAELLCSKGIENFMVEIGGEVVTKGVNSKGKSWNIGISKPTDNPGTGANELQEVISISGKSMATSGNYRNFRIEGNKKIAHTIDPRTGYPVQHSLLSATVIADDCTTADAYATAFMVMGLEKAQEFCNTKRGIEAFFIYADSRGEITTTMTKGFTEYTPNRK